VNGTRPTIEDFKKKFSNIPQDGSVEVTIEKEPDYTKKSETQQKVILIFRVKSTNQITKTFVFVKIVKPVVDENNPEKQNPEKENPEKQPDKNTIDKKSEKSQLENGKEKPKSPTNDQSNRVELKSDEKTKEKTNGKTDTNIDTKTQDEKQKNLENLKEEIR
ncbi:MAG: hypothetical protein E6Z65_08960, partial [Finegoldia magna]|nr:hypothetical protein [Finegoldia magna]